jgi:hypothetical protein
MSEDIDINIQYEQIFGREERPNIFKPDDEGYIALRREILASKREVVENKELPFSGINIIPCGEINEITLPLYNHNNLRKTDSEVSVDKTHLKNVSSRLQTKICEIISALRDRAERSMVRIRRTVKDETQSNTQRLFYIIRNDKKVCYAIGCFDADNKKFILQAGSIIAFYADSLYDMSMAGTSRARFIARYCSKDETGYRLKKDYTFDSPDDAASYVLGRTANGWSEWIDEDGNTLYSIIRSRK